MSRQIRRRGRSETRTVKKSFTLHADVVKFAEAAVRDGQAENLSAFVEHAIEEQLRRGQRDKRDTEYALAANDPAFMAEMRMVTREFERGAGDGLDED